MPNNKENGPAETNRTDTRGLFTDRSHCTGKPVHAANGRIVGFVRGTVLCKKVLEHRHMLKRPPAWACDTTALVEAVAAGAKTIELYATDTNRVWVAPLVAFFQYGRLIDFGWGKQLALGLEHWTIRPDSETRQEEVYGSE